MSSFGTIVTVAATTKDFELNAYHGLDNDKCWKLGYKMQLMCPCRYILLKYNIGLKLFKVIPSIIST